MMRDLTALHTSMSAASKGQSSRSKRSTHNHTQQPQPLPSMPGPSLPLLGSGSLDHANGQRRAAEEMQRSLSANYGQQHPLGFDVRPDNSSSRLPPQ